MNFVPKGNKLHILLKIGIITLGISSLSFITIFPYLQSAESSITEADFFAYLDQNNENLTDIIDAAESGNYTKAKIFFRDYMINRKNDSNYYFSGTPPNASADLAIDRNFTSISVNKILPNITNEPIIVNGRFRPNTNWHDNPYPEDDEWIWQFSRFRFLPSLAKAFKGNFDDGNEEAAEYYGTACIDLLTDFINKEPVGSMYTWRTIDSGLRISRFLFTIENIRFSDDFTADFCFRFVRFILEHGKYLNDFHKNQFNWAFIESNALIEIRGYFPEFAVTEKWELEAWQTFADALRLTIYPDGGSREQAINYHFVALTSILDAFTYTTIYDHLIPPNDLHTTVELMSKFSLYNTKPDFYSTSFGDSSTAYNWHRVKIASRLFPDIPELSFFDNVTGKPIQGRSPPNLSVFFPDSGIAISRSNWNINDSHDKNALYSWFDAGRHGEFYHQHNDFASLQLYAFERTFLIDPGVKDYAMSGKTQYYISSHAHNVVMLDGEPQNSINPSSSSWIAGDLGSVTRAAHTQYGGTLERELLFCNFRQPNENVNINNASAVSDKSRYWIVSDFWKGTGAHDVRMLYHLPDTDMIPMNANSTEITIDARTDGIVCDKTNFTDSNIGIYSLGPWEDTEEIHGGTLDEHGQYYGWRSDTTDYGSEEIATTMLYDGEINGKHAWCTIFYPSIDEPNINATRLDFTVNGNNIDNLASGNSVGNILLVETTDGKQIHVSLMDDTGSESEIEFSYAGRLYAFQGEQISIQLNKTTGDVNQILSNNLIKLSIDSVDYLTMNDNTLHIKDNSGLKGISLGYCNDMPTIIKIGNTALVSDQYSIRNNAININQSALEGI